MRLIDADEVREHQFHGCYTNIHIASKTDAYMLGWNDAIDAIVKCAPTVDAESLITQHEDIGYERGYRDGYAEALEVTDDAEPVKHGHWVGIDDRVWGCDVCGWIYEDDEPYYNFCPHCGSKMEESDEQDI